MYSMENHPLFHSLTGTRMHLGTKTWYCLLWPESILGTTDGIWLVPISYWIWDPFLSLTQFTIEQWFCLLIGCVTSWSLPACNSLCLLVLSGTWGDSQVWNEKLQKHSSWRVEPIVMARTHCSCEYTVCLCICCVRHWVCICVFVFTNHWRVLTFRTTLPMTKVRSGLRSFSPLSTPSSLPRSHSRQRSITQTSTRRARCACLWSVQRTGNLPPKLTKVCVYHA